MALPAPINARVTHMLTVPLLVEMLVSSYAQAHNCLEEEVMDDVKRGLVDASALPPKPAGLNGGTQPGAAPA